MSNIRTRKTHNFSVISNTILTDTRLSWEARGLAAYILSKPDGWVMNTAHLITQAPGGRYKILRICKELEEAGYLVRKVSRKSDGTFVHFTDLYEEPQSARVEESRVGKPDSGKPHSLLNTESTNTELNKNSRDKSTGGFPHPIPERMELTPELRMRMTAVGCSLPFQVFENFKTYYMARRNVRLTDWEMELIRWTQNQFPKTPTPGSGSPPSPKLSPQQGILQRRWEELHDQERNNRDYDSREIYLAEDVRKRPRS